MMKKMMMMAAVAAFTMVSCDDLLNDDEPQDGLVELKASSDFGGFIVTAPINDTIANNPDGDEEFYYRFLAQYGTTITFSVDAVEDAAFIEAEILYEGKRLTSDVGDDKGQIDLTVLLQ